MKKFLVVSTVFGILFVIFGLNLSAQSSDDKNACAYARKESSIDTWKFYLENFPNGECSDEAKAALEGAQNAKDQIACNQARQENSFAGWQKYLTNFPNGKCNFEAKVNKKKLKKTTDLEWSGRSSKEMRWSDAVSYCKSLNEGGYSDWRLPNIDELKTLLNANRVTNNCRVSEKNNCLSSSCWSCSTCTQTGTQNSNNGGCFDWGTAYSDGRYSKLGDTVYLWSSSTRSDSTGNAWLVNFSYGSVNNSYKASLNLYVRCVR